MNHAAILATRLYRQFLSRPFPGSPAEVARHLCAMQAQDFAAAKWAIGLRCPGITDADVEKALEACELIRISSLRGTLHFMHPGDVRWITSLVMPRVTSQCTGMWKKLALDKSVFDRVFHIMQDTLKNGAALSRAELRVILEKNHIATGDHRMNQFLTLAGLEQVICCGPRRGKEFTYVLLDEWLPPVQAKPPKNPLSELAVRYMAGHGPATAEDFSWWCGFPVTQCRQALNEASQQLESFVLADQTYYLTQGERIEKPDGKLRLLSGFDEYYISYADRSLVAGKAAQAVMSPQNGILPYVVIAKGKIVGTWRREIRKQLVEMEYIPFEKTKTGEGALSTAAKTYGKFMGLAAAWIE